MSKKANENNVNAGINDHSLNEEQNYSDNITSTILQNLQEGVFFLNPKYEIEKFYSSSLEEILGVKNLKNKNFITLLENRIPEQIVINAREYLELMFKNDLDEEVINELNPLIETEFFFEDEWGIWKSSKYLSFNFKRVLEGDKVISLMATILDESDKIVLDEKLKQTEEHTQKQMEWLVNILHVEPDLLKDFFVGVGQELKVIEQALKVEMDAKKHYELLEKIYRALYIIKGNASLLDLRFFSDKATRFLEKIVQLKNKKDLQGTDFVPIVVLLGDMQQTLTEVEKIFKRISHFHNHFRAKRTYESELLVNSLHNLIRGLSNQLGKDVEFDYKDFDALSIPYIYRQMVRDVLFLLIRNAILYGIENAEQRKSNNKNPQAIIKISSVINNGLLGLVLRHDGRIDRIERQLQKMVNIGESDDDSKNEFGGSKVSQLLFMPNIQTDDEKEVENNYSMDMELLKEKLKEIGGRLKITFTSEEYCEFTVLFPIKNVG